MSIQTEVEFLGIKQVSEVVATALAKMREYAQPGMTTWDLDQYGKQLLEEAGAQSAPMHDYDFPGYTCICVNGQVAHGIPNKKTVIQTGDLINIDVSALKDGFYSDNGGSFVLGEDKFGHQELVGASKEILFKAINAISGGVKINAIGHIIESEAKKKGYKVIKNLAGHGIGRALHEEPTGILNYRDYLNTQRFKKNSVVAIETFIATKSTQTITTKDGWTMVGNKGGFVAQHEHTIVVTEAKPIILTKANGIWN